MQTREWSIQQLARLTGVTSRTLRHYDDIGLLTPARVGQNGYRYYGEAELRALQRILLLKELGVGLHGIRNIVTSTTDEVRALTDHLDLLERERARMTSQIKAVKHTIAALERKETLMAEDMFAGFDHRQHRDEVRERWGHAAEEASSQWWEGLTASERGDWKAEVDALNEAWIAAWKSGASVTSPEAVELAHRHIAWLASVPGTPAHTPGGDVAGYVRALGEMYVVDERFAANYGGVEGATFVRDALLAALDE